MSRPALATPFDIRVDADGGFDEPVRIAVDQAYLRLWDENGLVPAPRRETVHGRLGHLGVRPAPRRPACS